MRVAVLNRDRDVYPGGDLVHIDEVSKAMEPLGVERVYQRSQTLKHDHATNPFDVFHIHHVNFSWCRMNFDAVAEIPDVPIVITTIFYPTETFGVSYEDMCSWLESAARVITYSRREAWELRQRTLFTGSIIPVHPGVSSAFYDVGDPMQRTGIVTVAARAGDKNCHRVERICRDLNIPHSQAIGVSRWGLPAVYKSARVFVNTSTHESFGLTILEALAANCRVLATDRSWGLEWLPGIMPIDPGDEDALRRAIEMAYCSDSWNYLPNDAARTMSWEAEARTIEALYHYAVTKRRTSTT